MGSLQGQLKPTETKEEAGCWGLLLRLSPLSKAIWRSCLTGAALRDCVPCLVKYGVFVVLLRHLTLVVKQAGLWLCPSLPSQKLQLRPTQRKNWADWLSHNKASVTMLTILIETSTSFFLSVFLSPSIMCQSDWLVHQLPPIAKLWHMSKNYRTRNQGFIGS